MSSTLARVDGLDSRPVGGPLGLAAAYFELTKPRIIVLLLVTTLAAMLMAAHGIPPLGLVFWTLLGGALSSASAGALNCVYDADIDGLMRRTRTRPIPTGRIAIVPATLYAVALGILAFAILFLFVNPLAAWLSLAGNLYYVGIYTMWLKRRTPLNIVIGGAAGSIPPLVGWAAVTGTLAPAAFGLFVLVFLWTPPHFWSLALYAHGDYARAGVPMLPVVAGARATRRRIMLYTLLLVPLTLLPWALGEAGRIYGLAAGGLGIGFLVSAWRVLRDAQDEAGRSLTKDAPARAAFRYSILYLFVLFAALAVDRLVG